MQRHEDRWLRHFGAEPLAAGMESAVYRLGDGRVAKVWARRTSAELARLKAFYDELSLPFATPVIEEIREIEGATVTFERELAGSPLPTLPHDERAVVHGDIVPANILVDDELRPLALLDFGFLSIAGDPAFDAAVAAGIWDMYGPRARETEALLDYAIAERFGYDPERLALYRAAYAVITSNAYDAEGADGHFAWCAALLRRETSGL